VTTFYIRSRRDGMIVNAVEADGRLTAEKVLTPDWYPVEDYFLDQSPPMDVLKAYRFWDERP
jgi:hypothetical protein